MASQNFVTRPGSQFVQSGTGAVERTIEEKSRESVSILDYGASTSNSGSANITAILACLAANNGKVVLFPPGNYSVNSSITIPAGTTILGYGATLTMEATVSPYSMIYPSSNTKIYGLSLVGYVASGTNFSNVVPNTSFGFRVQNDSYNVLMYECNVDNIPFDGWYITSSCKDIYLVNCTGGMSQECYRNTIAVAPSGPGKVLTNIHIQGGIFNKAKDRPSIDVEPDSSAYVESCFISDIRVLGTIDCIVNVQSMSLRNITFDGSNSGLNVNGCRNITLDSLDFINGAEALTIGDFRTGSRPSSSNVDLTKATITNIKHPGSAKTGPNLIQGSFNSIYGWSLYAAGPGTSAISGNYDYETNKAIRIFATNRAFQYTKNFAVSSGVYYSIGASLLPQTSDSNSFATFTTRFFDSSNNIIIENHNQNKFVNVVQAPNGAVSGSVIWGSRSSAQIIDIAVTNIFVREGITSDYCKHTTETQGPLWAFVPSGVPGYWYQGETATIPNPTSYIGYVCTAAGDPASWKTFGSITP